MPDFVLLIKAVSNASTCGHFVKIFARAAANFCGVSVEFLVRLDESQMALAASAHRIGEDEGRNQRP